MSQFSGRFYREEIAHWATVKSVESAMPVLSMGHIGWTTDTRKLLIGTGSANILIGGAGTTGDVFGPGSSVDNNIASFNGTTGKIIRDSGIPLTDVSANTNHRGRIDNPHSVYPAQIGAADLVHTHTVDDVLDQAAPGVISWPNTTLGLLGINASAALTAASLTSSGGLRLHGDGTGYGITFDAGGSLEEEVIITTHDVYIDDTLPTTKTVFEFPASAWFSGTDRLLTNKGIWINPDVPYDQVVPAQADIYFTHNPYSGALDNAPFLRFTTGTYGGGGNFEFNRPLVTVGTYLASDSIVGETTPTEVTIASLDIVNGVVDDSGVSETAVTQHEGAIDHTNIQNIGSNTHAQIDSHIADTSTNPHGVDKTDVGLGNVVNSEQLYRTANDFTTFALRTPAVADFFLFEDASGLGAKAYNNLGALPVSTPMQTALNLKTDETDFTAHTSDTNKHIDWQSASGYDLNCDNGDFNDDVTANDYFYNNGVQRTHIITHPEMMANYNWTSAPGLYYPGATNTYSFTQCAIAATPTEFVAAMFVLPEDYMTGTALYMDWCISANSGSTSQYEYDVVWQAKAHEPQTQASPTGSRGREYGATSQADSGTLTQQYIYPQTYVELDQISFAGSGLIGSGSYALAPGDRILMSVGVMPASTNPGTSTVAHISHLKVTYTATSTKDS